MLLLELVAARVLATSALAASSSRGAVSTQTNDPSGNAVQQFFRAADGSPARPARSRRAAAS